MPNKPGAGGKPQAYDKSTGRYGDGSDKPDKPLTDFERKIEALAKK